MAQSGRDSVWIGDIPWLTNQNRAWLGRAFVDFERCVSILPTFLASSVCDIPPGELHCDPNQLWTAKKTS